MAAASSSSSSSALNKKTDKQFEYEFGGPVGATFLVATLPITILYFVNASHQGYLDLTPFTDLNRAWDVFCPSCRSEPVRLLQSAAVVLGWFAFQVVLERTLPGPTVQGTPVHGNPHHRLSYCLNGHTAFWVTVGLALVATVTDTFPFQTIYETSAELAWVTCLFCLAGSFLLYQFSFAKSTDVKQPKVLAHGGNSNVPIYDYFIGRELNPRTGTFDWKVFCELRPGLIGWMLLNWASLLYQYHLHQTVSYSMGLIFLAQAVYVWDALFQERAILTTMDVTTDGFGFMLLCGDLAWVPFTYSLQCRYLVHHDPQLSLPVVLAISALYAVGFYIFRGANGQKDRFRRQTKEEQDQSNYTYLQTARGTRLMTSGWWGMARKINYTGDWLMGLSWCMWTGTGSLVPYFYAVYFFILLLHRAMRDDGMCREKYGVDWDRYKQAVPYLFVPGIL